MFKGSCDNTKPKLLGFSDNKGLKDKMQPGFVRFLRTFISVNDGPML